MAEGRPPGRPVLWLRGLALLALALGSAVAGGLILLAITQVVIGSFGPLPRLPGGGDRPPGLGR